MSTTATENEMDTMPTKPVPEHAWLKKLIGNWKTETEMWMEPDKPPQKVLGTETVTDIGGLWAYAEGTSKMADGNEMVYKSALGYDVSFKEYRGCTFMSVSSHLWKTTGKLSADGRVMTLDCIGPSMTKDGETANYRDVIELIDDDHRTLTSSGQQDNGEWQLYMKTTLTRV